MPGGGVGCRLMLGAGRTLRDGVRVGVRGVSGFAGADGVADGVAGAVAAGAAASAGATRLGAVAV